MITKKAKDATQIVMKQCKSNAKASKRDVNALLVEADQINE